MFCTKCGANNADGAKFCSQCGNPIGSAAVPPSGTFGAYSGGATSSGGAPKRINPRDYFKAATNLDGTSIAPPKPIVPDIPVEPPVVSNEATEIANTTPVEEPVAAKIDTPVAPAEVKAPEVVEESIAQEMPTSTVEAVKNDNEQAAIKAVQEIAANTDANTKPTTENTQEGVTVNVELPATDAKGKKKKPKKEKKKGGKKGLKITGIVILVLAVLAVVGFVFKDFLMFHFMPKIYTMSAVTKTVDVLNTELGSAGMNFTGVDPESEELTVKISAAVTGLRGDMGVNDATADIAVSRSKKDANFKMSADASINGTAYDILDALWDDSVIAVKSTGVLGEETVYTIPSKDFGKKFNESVHQDRFDIPESLDLAASNFISDGEKKVEDKATVKKLVEAMGKFVDNTEIKNKETVKLTIDGKERSVHKLDFEAEDKDFAEFMKEFVIIAKDSETMRFVYDLIMEEYESEEAMEEALDDMEFDDVNVNFYIYKGMVVRCDVVNENQTVFFGFTKTENLLDNFTTGSINEYEYDGEDLEWTNTITCEGNLTTGGDKVENVYTIVSEDEGEVTEETVVTVTFDFKKGEFNIEVIDALDEDEDAPVTVISGTCSRGKDGFKIAFGDITRTQGDSSYSMLKILADEIKLEVEITPSEDIAITSLDENRVDVLSMTEDEFDAFIEKISKGVEEIISF